MTFNISFNDIASQKHLYCLIHLCSSSFVTLRYESYFVKFCYIFIPGHGYKIVTPETFAMLEKGYLNEQPPAPIFLPLPVPSKTTCSEMRSISCQTANAEGDSSTLSESQEHPSDIKVEKKEKKSRRSRLDRSNSVRIPKKDKKAKEEGLSRSNSLRYNEEKTAAIVTSLNSKDTKDSKEADVISSKEKGGQLMKSLY